MNACVIECFALPKLKLVCVEPGIDFIENISLIQFCLAWNSFDKYVLHYTNQRH